MCIGQGEQEISILRRNVRANYESGEEGTRCICLPSCEERAKCFALYAGAAGLGLGHCVIPQVILLVIGVHKAITDPSARRIKSRPETTILLGLIVWMMLSAIPAIRPYSALGGAIGMALSGWVVFGAVSRVLIERKERGKSLIQLFLGSACIGAIYALANYASALAKGRGYYRAELPFVGSNAAGTVFCVAILTALGYFRSADRRGKLMMLPVIVLLTVALIATQSRGAFVAFLAGFLVFLMPGAKSRQNLIVKIAALAGLVCIVAFFFRVNPSVATRYARILNPMANRDRLEIWRTALLMIRDHPVLGVGVNNFVNFYPLYEHPEGFGTSMYMAHNIFLEFGATTGIPGLILFSLAIALGIYRGVRSVTKVGSKEVLPVTALAVFCAILVHLQFDITLNSGDMLPFFFVPYGILTNLDEWLEQRTKEDEYAED